MSESPINARLTIPNVITSLRLLLLPPFVACLVLQSFEDATVWPHWAAFGLFLLMSVTDMFDGYLARRLGQITRLGALLDAVADKTLLAVSMFLLYLVGVRLSGGAAARTFALPLWVLLPAIAKDLLVWVGYSLLRRLAHDDQVRPGWIGKTSTTAQMLLVLAMLLWFIRPETVEPIARVLFVVATLLALATMASYTRIGLRRWRAGRVGAAK